MRDLKLALDTTRHYWPPVPSHQHGMELSTVTLMPALVLSVNSVSKLRHPLCTSHANVRFEPSHYLISQVATWQASLRACGRRERDSQHQQVFIITTALRVLTPEFRHLWTEKLSSSAPTRSESAQENNTFSRRGGFQPFQPQA